jgi:quercetin dioxygenase-like cupin family protein
MRRRPVLLAVVAALLGSAALWAHPGTEAQEATPVTEEVLAFGPVPAYPPEPAAIGLLRTRIAPGGQIVVPAEDPALGLLYVEAGAVTVRFTAPVVVVRGATQAEERVPASEEFTLQAGDAFVAPPPSGGEFRNEGAEEATILVAVVVPVEEGTPTP